MTRQVYENFEPNHVVTRLSCDSFQKGLYNGSATVMDTVLRGNDEVAWTAKQAEKSGDKWHIVVKGKNTELVSSEELKKIISDWITEENDNLPGEAGGDSEEALNQGHGLSVSGLKPPSGKIDNATLRLQSSDLRLPKVLSPDVLRLREIQQKEWERDNAESSAVVLSDLAEERADSKTETVAPPKETVEPAELKEKQQKPEDKQIGQIMSKKNNDPALIAFARKLVCGHYNISEADFQDTAKKGPALAAARKVFPSLVMKRFNQSGSSTQEAMKASSSATVYVNIASLKKTMKADKKVREQVQQLGDQIAEKFPEAPSIDSKGESKPADDKGGKKRRAYKPRSRGGDKTWALVQSLGQNGTLQEVVIFTLAQLDGLETESLAEFFGVTPEEIELSVGRTFLRLKGRDDELMSAIQKVSRHLGLGKA